MTDSILQLFEFGICTNRSFLAFRIRYNEFIYICIFAAATAAVVVVLVTGQNSKHTLYGRNKSDREAKTQTAVLKISFGLINQISFNAFDLFGSSVEFPAIFFLHLFWLVCNAERRNRMNFVSHACLVFSLWFVYLLPFKRQMTHSLSPSLCI